MKTQWAKPGDTVSTVSRMCGGLHAGEYLQVEVTAENCAEANRLIETGRWYVSGCGSAAFCTCDESTRNSESETNDRNQ